MIRYRLSLNHELCHLEIGGRGHQSKRLFQRLLGNHSWGLRGDMVTKLKVKGIDGRAPPDWSLRPNLTQQAETYWVQT